MKKAILALGLIAGALATTTAVAQDRYGNGYGNGYGYGRDYQGRDGYRSYERGVHRNFCGNVRGSQLEFRISSEARRGDIDRRTASALRAMVNDTQNLQHRYCNTGLNNSRARELDQRYDQIERRLRRADDDHDGWRR